jgi:Fe-S-cluster-containing dehydrogenase component
MAKYGFAINLKRCVGCRTCIVACKMENKVPANVTRIEVYNGDGSTVYDTPTGTFPNFEYIWTPVPCQQCDNAPCVAACPVKATYQREDGIVVINNEMCIGCGACVPACPYNSRFMNENTGKADKCDMCAHRKEEGKQTMCELCCPARAIVTGDMDDPESEISKVIANNKTWHEKEDTGTKPNVFYYRA